MERHELEIYIELYKRKQFNLIPVYKDLTGYYFLSKPQLKTLEYLWDDTTFYVGYGGSGMSGKTQLECFYNLFNALAYHDTRWMMGRSELKNLEATTFQTMFKTISFYGLKKDIDYRYDGTKKYFQFENTSMIIGKDTKFYPSDPLFTDLGGLELSGATLDESVENVVDVINILTTRVGRWNNGKYGIKGKILEGFNPAKNHVYERYWKPFKKNKETIYTKFVRALCTDNPHPDAIEWAENVLKTSDKRTIQRLYYGNFDYDDDDNSLIDYNSIINCFTNTFVKEGEMYISSDIAITNDRFTVFVWSGLRIKEVVSMRNVSRPVETMIDNITTTQVNYQPLIDEFKRLSDKWRVPRSNICYDADGLGKNIKEYLKGAVPIYSGQKAINNEYFNLKAELHYKLAEIVNNNELYFDCYLEPDLKERIISQFQAIKRSSEVGDKLKISPKSEVKKQIGQSPDESDGIVYRMYFIIKPKKTAPIDFG